VTADIAAHRTDQAAVDRAVKRLLSTLFAHHFFDRDAYVDDDSRIDKAGHFAAARRIEEAGITLLENKGVLPLKASNLHSLAVIGSDGDGYKNGGGSSSISPYLLVPPRAGIEARAGAGVDVRYDPGTDLDSAARAARGADAAIVVVADTAGEGSDKPCLALDCGSKDSLRRDRLIDRVATVNPKTIVVLETGGPVLTPWRTKVKGIVEAWYPGAAGGAAIARVLFGDVDPGGRLPATFPRRARDLPTAGDPRRYPGVNDVVHYSEGVLVGYRWYDARRIAPAFPFGFGLSYARFAYRHLRVHRSRGVALVDLDVVNTSRRSGVAVPQVYVGLPGALGRVQPPRQLKAFRKLTLRPGGRAHVRLLLDRRAFSYWDTRHQRWAIAPGCYRIEVGSSSRDVKQVARLPIGRRACT
jgi:beta-glucosidase